MPLVILGLIVIIAAVLLIYFSSPAGRKGDADKRKASRGTGSSYEHSDDGKVVYLFGPADGKDKNDNRGGNDTDSKDGADPE